MKVWLFRTVTRLHNKVTTEIIPCASMKIAKACLIFRLENIKQMSSFQESENISKHNDDAFVICNPEEKYWLSIQEEEIRESPWEM